MFQDRRDDVWGTLIVDNILDQFAVPALKLVESKDSIGKLNLIQSN